MKFKEKYTTLSKKSKDSEGEKDKIEISEESFAIGELLEEIKEQIRFVRSFR